MKIYVFFFYYTGLGKIDQAPLLVPDAQRPACIKSSAANVWPEHNHITDKPLDAKYTNAASIGLMTELKGIVGNLQDEVSNIKEKMILMASTGNELFGERQNTLWSPNPAVVNQPAIFTSAMERDKVKLSTYSGALDKCSRRFLPKTE